MQSHPQKPTLQEAEMALARILADLARRKAGKEKKAA